MLVVVGERYTVAGHDGEEVGSAMGKDGQREVVDLIVERVLAHGIDTHHAVGQVGGRARGFKQDAYVTDGSVDFVDWLSLGRCSDCGGEDDEGGDGFAQRVRLLLMVVGRISQPLWAVYSSQTRSCRLIKHI